MTDRMAYDIVLKNSADLTWEKMIPELGESSPVFAILRVDPVSGATTLLLDFPKRIHIPKHTHAKGETHIVVAGSLHFDQEGRRLEVETGGYVYMSGGCVHEAWASAGCRAIIILEAGWQVDWVEGGPTERDLMG